MVITTHITGIQSALYIRGLECTISAQRGRPGRVGPSVAAYWARDIEQTTGRFSHTPQICRRPMGRGCNTGRHHPGRNFWMCCKAAGVYLVKAALKAGTTHSASPASVPLPAHFQVCIFGLAWCVYWLPQVESLWFAASKENRRHQFTVRTLGFHDISHR